MSAFSIMPAEACRLDVLESRLYDVCVRRTPLEPRWDTCADRGHTTVILAGCLYMIMILTFNR